MAPHLSHGACGCNGLLFRNRPSGHNRAVLQFEREKYEQSKREKDAKERAEQQRSELNRVMLDACLADADTNYWDYIKLNGRTNSKKGTVWADTRIWDQALKNKEAQVNECRMKYGER